MKKNDLDIEELFGEGLMAELTEDMDEAIEKYTLAAEGGSIDAMSRLGYIYYNEKGYKNTAEAFKWCSRTFEKAAKLWEENGDTEELEPFVDTIVALGEMYEYGFGTEKNETEAIKCYKLAAETDDAESMRRLGYIYYANEEYKEAFQYFEMANEDYHFSDFMLAEQYFHVDKNYAEALKWYTKAAEVGVEEATFRIGEIYYYGLGTERDYKAAFDCLKYYEDDFDEDFADAPARVHYMLGTMYRDGLGVEKNPAEAKKLLAAAEKDGYKI